MAVSPADDTKAADSLEVLVTQLFDAVRYSEEVVALEEQKKKLEKESNERLARLDGFHREISVPLERLKERDDADYVDRLSTQVKEFVGAAVEQAKSRASEEDAKELSEVASRMTSEKTKALKSLESYLVSSPIPLMERTLTVRLGDSGYEAEVHYSCKGNISYRFTLATQNSRFFHRGFRFSAQGKRINLPVGLQRTWIRKEPTPHYEKLERFSLTSAEVSERHIIAEFFNEETQAKVRMAGAGPDGEGIPSIEYSENGKVTNVTNDTGLNKYIDSMAMAEAIRDLRSELLSLEKNKAALKELTLDGEDVLEGLEFLRLLKAVFGVMGSTYKSLVQNMAARPLKTRNGVLTLSQIRERLALLGPSSVIARDGLAMR